MKEKLEYCIKKAWSIYQEKEKTTETVVILHDFPLFSVHEDLL
jgi:hypothetical protein